MPLPTPSPRSVAALQHYTQYWTGRATGPRLSIVTEPTYRQTLDPLNPDIDAAADAAAACIRADLHRDDPTLLPTVYADFGTVSTASLYGGKLLPPTSEGAKLHIEPIINHPQALADLTPCPFQDSHFQLAVDLWQAVCNRLNTTDVFLRTPDFQGPLNTLALVMDQQELMVAFYEAPDAIHAALESITTTLIHYHQRLRETLGGGRVIGNIWPYTFLPEPLGAAITQDMMPLLSAKLYHDFELPQIRRIARAFGGLLIHCCGKYTQHLPTLRDAGIPIRGLEFHHPFTPFKDIHATFGDDIVYIPYLFSECHDYQDYLAFARDLLRQGTPDTRFWFAQTTACADEAPLRDLIAQQHA